MERGDLDGLDHDPFGNVPYPFRYPFDDIQSASGPPSAGPSAPPPSSYGTGSENSSACPSPGPMKKFKQIYGDPSVPSSTNHQPSILNGTKTTMNWTENWMNAHHGCDTKPHTSTSSIISTGSAVTELSALSVDTQLSRAVDLINLGPSHFQTEEPCASNGSHIENVDPFYSQQLQNYLAYSVQQLNLMDEISELNAIYQLYRLAKDHKFHFCSESGQLCQIIQRLVEIILRPNTTSKTRSLVLNILYKMATAGNVCLNAIRSLESADRGFFINTIILCLRSDVENDSRFATNILRILFSHPTLGEFFRRQSRTQHVIRDLLMALQRENFGFRHLFLRLLYCLIRPSKELKRFFLQSNGMFTCLELFRNSIDEPMLYASAALVQLLVDDQRTIADQFVRLNGIQTFAGRLDHGSPRLLLAIARCLASVSDSDQLAHQSIGEAITLSIQLLASTDGELVKNIIGFLANIQAKNPEAKTFMQTHEAIPNLLFLLLVWTNSSLPSITTEHNCAYGEGKNMNCDICKHTMFQKYGTDELIDTVLLALCNLTNGINACPLVSCKAIMEFQDGDVVALFHHILVTPDRPELIHLRVLTLLSRLLSHLSPSIIQRFALFNCEYLEKSYACTLLKFLSNSIQRIIMLQQGLFNKYSKTIAALSLHVLNMLTKHRVMFEAIVTLIRQTEWNPFILLYSLKDEKLEQSLAEFLCQLSSCPELLIEWTRFAESLRNCRYIPHISIYIDVIYNRMMQGINNTYSM